jgi:uncharacterized protein (DUF1778 family)
MKAPGSSNPNITNLKPRDYQAFFEALASPAAPSEALRAAFRRRKDFPADLYDIEQAGDS